MDNYIGKSSPGAAIEVKKGKEIIFSKGYGYADVEHQIKVDPARTVFEYDSVNKLFVWTAVMEIFSDYEVNRPVIIDHD